MRFSHWRLSFMIRMVLAAGIGLMVTLAAVAQSNSSGPIGVGSPVVVCRPTELKIESQVVAHLPAGTELKVEKVQENWLWVAYVPPEDEEKESEKEVKRGWVLREDVIPGPGGRWWWLRMLPKDLQDLVCRGAREALEDKDWDVREAAAEALVRIASQQGVAALREALKDEDSDVRSAAAWALGNLADRESIPALREALKDEDEYVRSAAAEALLQLGWFPQTKPELVYVVSHVGSAKLLRREAKEIALADLEDPNGPHEWAAHTLISLGEPDTVPSLVRFLNRGGTLEIAHWYFNCGQPELEQAARSWAEARGYGITREPGDPVVRWGR